MTDTIRQHIEMVQGAGGPKAVIAGHRVRVEDVVIWHEKLGMSSDEIVDAIPTLTLAEVYAALAYYWDNREEIERQIADGRAESEEFRRLLDDGRLAEKLRRRID
jgi:uncharacterized protein (DUF433 family)